MSVKKIGLVALVCAVFLLAGPAGKVSANHSWGGYHWERSANPVQLSLGNNLSGEWQQSFGIAVADWNSSSVLSLLGVPGSTGTRRCKADPGEIEVCNDTYGNNGWLGIAGISVSGSHIVSAYVKLNDTYYSGAPYNTPAWRNLVMCQEIGHAFGLDHQDENFNNANLGTCMDYTNDPSTNQHPNNHDYQQLADIYSHLDGDGGGGGGGGGNGPPDCRGRNCRADIDFSDPRQWGRVIETDDQGRPILYMRDLGNGRKHFTHIYPVRDTHRGRPH